MRLLFDIESNGLLDTVSKIWCLGIIDLDTNISKGYGPNDIEEGLSRLEEASELWGHNIITYDIPCIHKLSTYPRLTSKKYIDTLILSRIYYPHIGDGMDWVLIRRGVLPANMRGRHSLEAWGHRIGVKKDSYGKDRGFDEYTPAMLDYCLQDLQVNLAFIRKIEKECNRSQLAEDIEMDFQQDIATHGSLGCPFKIEEATKYHDKLERVGGIVFKKIKEMIPDKQITETIYPARSDKKKGIVKGVSYQSTKTIDVNPRSTDQMADYFKAIYDWKPEKFTDKNKIAMDDAVLQSLTFPEVKYLRMMYAIDKVQSKLKGTSKALLANTIGDRIYGGVITLGAVTGRCTHMVISNMPMELRPFFGLTDDSWRMVGCDAKAIQLRILAHYIDNYDKNYKDVVLNGDIHTTHQKAFGLDSRDVAKTFIYAFIFGAGQEKLGSIINPTVPSHEQKRIGKQAMDKMAVNLPALSSLINDVKHTFSVRGYVKGVDGRPLFPRGAHTALCTLIQNAESVIMKRATRIMIHELESRGIFAQMVIHYHDEYNWICHKEDAEQVAEISTIAITKASNELGMKCVNEGSAKIGMDWKEIH